MCALVRVVARRHAAVAALVLIALLASAGAAAAQPAPRPNWSFGIALGEGRHPDRAGDVYYGSSSSNTGQLALAYRFGSAQLRPVVRAELLTEGPGSDWADCPLAPNGSCVRDFPAPDGLGAAAGVMYAATPRVEAGMLAGAGRYDGTTRRFLEAAVGIGLSRRVGATASLRHMTWNEPGLGRHWYRPVHLGARWQW